MSPAVAGAATAADAAFAAVLMLLLLLRLIQARNQTGDPCGGSGQTALAAAVSQGSKQ